MACSLHLRLYRFCELMPFSARKPKYEEALNLRQQKHVRTPHPLIFPLF